jgi:sugar O-acyltransferase (sialic acid O-acetyltransferase NeuD family)
MKIIIYGLGKFAEYASYVFLHDSIYEVCAFSVEKKYNTNNTNKYNNVPVIDFEDIQDCYNPNEYKMFVAIGDNEVRERVFYESKSKGYSFINYFSSKAIFWDNIIHGQNIFISEDSALNPFVSIDDNTIIIGAKIGHHTNIGKNNLLSCCYLAGNVKIGNNCFLGLNSCVKQNTNIGNNNIIGMGCLIEKDTKDNEIYHNNKITRKRSLTTDRFKNKYLK